MDLIRTPVDFRALTRRDNKQAPADTARVPFDPMQASISKPTYGMPWQACPNFVGLRTVRAPMDDSRLYHPTWTEHLHKELPIFQRVGGTLPRRYQ